MRGRDRLFATVAIWAAFAFVMNNLIDRFTMVNASFTGLWPTINDPNAWMNGEFQQLWSTVSQNAENMMIEVTQSVNAQLAANMPILVILSLAMIAAAILSTSFVWGKAHLEPAESPQQKQRTSRNGKVKRGGRVAQVMDALDDDELAELRARLVEAEDAEAVSFEELLNQRRR